MSVEEKTGRHERAAVAYAHRLTTDAGLIWREITGQDIGIDAILELPYPDKEENALRGFALLQVKSRSDALTRDQVSAEYKKRHHLYWLTQRLPVLLCVVEPEDLDGFTTARAGYWIDYKALAPDEYSITPTTNSRWKLRIPLKNRNVWSSKKLEQASWVIEAKEFRKWLERVLVRPAEAIVTAFREAADVYLGSGKPDQARACLEQLPIWEKVLVDASTQWSVNLLLAKTIRRLGAVDKQQELLANAPPGSEEADILTYELALTYWTRACLTAFPGRDLSSWQKAMDILGRPSEYAGIAPATLKRNLLALGAYVNIKSTFSCLTGDERDAPDGETRHILGELICRWKTTEDVGILSDHRYHLQLLNAMRSLCRGHLSNRAVDQAEDVLRELKQHMSSHPDRETLALTDFLLLTAWVAVERGEREAARATLECTTCLLKSMHDPLLEWFQEVVTRKLKDRAAPS